MFAGNSSNIKSFEDNVKKNKYNKMVSDDVKAMDYMLPGIGNNRQLVRWVYDNKVGDISEPMEMEDKYVVVAITSSEENDLPSAIKMRSVIEPILRNKEKAKQIKAKIKTISSLEAFASESGKAIRRRRAGFLLGLPGPL